MAAEIEVKEYLAHWFQLGKGVVIPKQSQILCPEPIFEGHHFSSIFEKYWQQILQSNEDCYLEGTEQTIKELLTPGWEMLACARCTLPIPVSRIVTPSCLCPCADLPLWPNSDLPLPRLPVIEHQHLDSLRSRLQAKEEEELF
jgi:hypothetical protein